MGNRNLRKLLVVGAHAVLFHRKPHTDPLGIVTLPWGEREASAAQEFSGCCDGGPPCVHRHSAKLAVRLG
jgi:hypothetical protein